MRMYLSVAVVGLMVLAGCAGPRVTAQAGAATQPAAKLSTIHLTAALVSPVDVVLNWQDTDKSAAGHIVEFANEENGEYVILDFLPPGQTSFKHSDLIPETKFYYRVRGIYGPTSAPVTVTLPAGMSDKEYADRFNGSEDYSWAQPQTLPEEGNVVKKPVRGDVGGAGEGAPTGLKVTMKPVTSSGFLLTWTDHASDEEGYLLEMRPEGAKEFQVCAVAQPNINSFGWGLTPPMRKAEFRVRAVYYGAPSNLARVITGKPPATQPAAGTK